MTTTERRQHLTPETAARRARERIWLDPVVVERALFDWVLGRPLIGPGRRLTLRERRVVLHALTELGTTRNEAAQHLRMSHAAVREVAVLPVAPSALATFHADVARALAYLRRHRGDMIIRMRRHPMTRAEVDRILALEIGHAEPGPAALFDVTYAKPR